MSRKHIAIDASRSTVSAPTGTEYYAQELIRNIILANDALDYPHTLTLYFRDTPPKGLFPMSAHVLQKVIPFQRAWTHLRFAYEVSKDKPDVTFVPAHTLPLLFRGDAVVTIHDLGYKLFPQAHPFPQRAYLDFTTRHSANRARVIFADSQATAHDLVRFYGIAERKIQVIYPAIHPPQMTNANIKEKYGLPERYFLFIGTLQPRKNIARLIKAYTLWRKNSNENIGLVLAGKKGWLFDETWLANTEVVHVTGYIDDAEKGTFYAHAEALVFPSLYEGFGFPVLEAMACGTPVIASNTSSLPELVGDAGLLVNPLDINTIAQALSRVLDANTRKALIERGNVQWQQFSWQKSARRALHALALVQL